MIIVIHMSDVRTIVSAEALRTKPQDLWLILGSPRGRLRNALSRTLRDFEAEKPLSAAAAGCFDASKNASLGWDGSRKLMEV